MYVAVRLDNGKEIASAPSVNELVKEVLKYDPTGDVFVNLYIGKPKTPPKKDGVFTWIFLDAWHENYIAIAEKDLTDEARYVIEGKGFDLFADSVLEGQVKTYMAEMEPSAKPVEYEIVSLPFKQAKEFVTKHHRHHKAPQGHKYSIGLKVNNELVGVLMAGRPVSRHLDKEGVLEVTRCCVLEGFKNGVSKLYGHLCRGAKAFGIKQVITYTLVTESGVSMKAVGFKQDCLSKGGSWDSPSRQRKDKHPTIPKIRWIKELSN